MGSEFKSVPKIIDTLHEKVSEMEPIDIPILEATIDKEFGAVKGLGFTKITGKVFWLPVIYIFLKRSVNSLEQKAVL